MNGKHVGEWGAIRTGTPFFRYASSWAESKHARALSLSLPLTTNLEIRGQLVESYFDNLLPESPEIRRRIRTRYGTRSSGAFDLLAAIGRDCVGAVQLLPPGDEPTGWQQIEAQRLSEADVERTLLSVTAPGVISPQETDDFRVSIAGAQEKTALLGMAGTWFRPQGSTPTTHIFKLPLGVIGNFRGDFSDSVENEWLCGRYLRELGFPVAASSIASFGEQKALVVRRFDRRWQGVDEEAAQKKRFKPKKGVWISRLPQEDFCQALGLAPTRKYQSDGGPSMGECLAVLMGSEQAQADRETFALVQLAFWLMAATDGHAKNFSLYQRAGGSFGLTPLYDVLSLWPVIGHGKNQLPIERAKLAMALRGNRMHYRLTEIQARHWQALAKESGVPELWGRMQELVERAALEFDALEGSLPRKFPARVFETIRAGIRSQVRRFNQSLGA